MSDIVYGVEVQFLQSGSLDSGSAGLEKLQLKTDKWGKSLFGTIGGFAGKFNGAIDSVVGTMVGAAATMGSTLGAGLAAGITVAAKVAFQFNEELEQTQISLAAIANANGTADNFGQGMRLAGDVITQMRKDAAKLPGEFKDLAGIMATVASPLSQLGVGMHATEAFSAQVMSAAAVLMGNKPGAMNIAGREMAMMLEGNARHQMPFFNRLNLGMGTKEFNKLAPEKRLALIQSALERLAPATNEFESKWNAIKTTSIDKIRSGIAQVGGPLFQSVKSQLKSLNDAAADPANIDKLSRIGEALGAGIDTAFHRGIDAVKHWYPVVKEFSVDLFQHLHAGWNRFEPLVDRLLKKAEGFMKDPAAFDKMEHLARTLIAVRAGGFVLEHGASMMPGLLQAAGGGSGVLAGIAELGVVAPVAAAGLALLSVSIYGAADMLMDVNHRWHGIAVNELSYLSNRVQDTVVNLEALGSTLKPVADVLGIALLSTLSSFADEAYLLVTAVKKVTEGMEWLYQKLTPWKPGPKLNGDETPNGWEQFDRSQIPIRSIKEMDTYASAERDRKIPVTNVHINKVEIHVAPNPDPNRVAKATKDLLMDEARRPKTALTAFNRRLRS